nr:YbdD/YjiX family protein [Nitrosomonas sp. Nm58]
MYNKIARTICHIVQCARLMVGMPEYSTYVEHIKNSHPDQPIMSYQEFFCERQESRYGANGKISRCC